MIGAATLMAAAAYQGGICPNASSSMEIIECVNAAYKRSDQRMTAEWRLALARMRNKDSAQVRRQVGVSFTQALLDSQRKWLAFRDSQCRLEGYRMRGGSGQGYSTTICLITLTNDRTNQLRRIDF